MVICMIIVHVQWHGTKTSEWETTIVNVGIDAIKDAIVQRCEHEVSELIAKHKKRTTM